MTTPESIYSKVRPLSPLLLIFIAGCASLPEAGELEIPTQIPDNWTNEIVSGTTASIDGWLDSFNDPELNALVDEALAQSPTLAAAEARLRAAEALALANQSGLWPSITGSGSARDEQKYNRSQGLDERSDEFIVTGTVSWELDLWGRVRAESGAAKADRAVAIGTYEAARLSLVANVARNWFNLREARAQELLANGSLKSFEDNLNLIEDRYTSGVSTSLEVRLLRANVAGARASLAARQREADVAARTLEALIGRYPSNKVASPLVLPELSEAPPPGIPAELLSRRPDLIASERAYQAAVFSAQEAQRARLPKISLTGRAGISSDELDDIVRGNFDFWSIAAEVTAPIFQGGRLYGNAKRAEALADAALADYVNDALTAFGEVEQALVADAFWRTQTDALSEASTESSAAEDQAWERYQRGLTDIITVLESQRRALNAQASLLSSQNQTLQNRINLHLALGGDFETLSATLN